MKLSRILILLLIAITFIQANPHRRHHQRPHRSNYYYSSLYASRYTPYYSPYRYYRYYSPIIVTTKTTTTYPTNLVMVTADHVAEDIVALNDLMSRGMITEKDFERSKKTLLNRIGMSVNPDAGGATSKEILDQIETLYQMQLAQLLTDKEYEKQKKKLLAMI